MTKVKKLNWGLQRPQGSRTRTRTHGTEGVAQLCIEHLQREDLTPDQRLCAGVAACCYEKAAKLRETVWEKPFCHPRVRGEQRACEKPSPPRL